jgi:hypothetical protein
MARYNLRDPRDYLAAIDFINRAKNRGVDIELKRFSPQRSNNQNSYLHLILSYFANQYGCTLVEAKEVYFKKLACEDIFKRVTSDKKGNQIECYRSTTELTQVEMSSAIQNFISYASLNGIELPMADDYMAQRICEREVEKTQYLGT